MRRSESEFPYEDDPIIFKFIKDMWKEGWLDDFCDENFLIRAVENRLSDFWGKQQAYRDNTLLYPIIDERNFVPTFLSNFYGKNN